MSWIEAFQPEMSPRACWRSARGRPDRRNGRARFWCRERRGRDRPARRSADETARRRNSSPSGARQAKPLRKVGSSSSPFGRVAYMPATSGSASQAEECRMPRKRPLPAAISASSTALAPSPSSRLTWLTMPALICGRAVAAAGAHRRDAIGELDLADRAQRFGPAGAVHRAAVDIDGGDDVVAGCDVGGHLLDHVAQAAAVPEMVMRIDDRPRGIDDLFRVCASQSSRGSAYSPLSRRAQCWRPFVTPCVRCFVARERSVRVSHPVENDHRRRRRQACRAKSSRSARCAGRSRTAGRSAA